MKTHCVRLCVQGQPPVRDMVAEGRRLLAAAEQEARHGAGAHAPLAELGEDHTSSAAGADARQSGGETSLQPACMGPALMTTSENLSLLTDLPSAS